MTNKSIVWICSLAIGVVGLAVLVVTNLMIRNYDRIESDQTTAKAEQVLRAFEADLNQLAISNRDYAEWDEAVQYVATRNHAFTDSNFTIDTLKGMHVDDVWLIQSDGGELLSVSIDSRTGQFVTSAPQSIFKLIKPYANAAFAAKHLPSLQRLVKTENGLLAFSAIEIRHTDRTGPTGVVMIFARHIDDDVLDRVRQTSGLPATLMELPDKAALLPSEIASWATNAGTSDTTITHTLSRDKIAGYTLIVDMNHHVLGLFSTEAQRTVAALGRHSTWTLMSVLVALIAIAAVVITSLFWRLQRSFNAHDSARHRHRNIVDALEEGVAVAVLETGEIVDGNRALAKMLRCEVGVLKQLQLQDIYLDIADFKALFRTGHPHVVRECRIRALDGHIVEAELSVVRLVDNGETLVCVVGRDLALRRQLELQEKENKNKLVAMAQTDALTGLPNRTYLRAMLPSVLGSLAGTEKLLALMYIDVDHFKNINEMRGHERGDELLAVIAKRLRTSIAAEDILVRMGGDEYVIAAVMPNEAAVRTVAKRILEVVHSPMGLKDGPATVTASIGIGLYPQDSIDAESLLKHADIALFQAKEDGRNCYRFFAADMDVQLSEHVALEQALRHALGTDQLMVEYQPVVDAYTGVLTSFEALARWRHPELGMIPPLRFIPVAEKSGLIIKLGEEVLRKVIRQQHLWQKENVPLAPVAINVSPLQFERTDFTILVHELCLAHELDPKWLHFEVTESSWLQESNKHIVALDSLRAQGSRISIDDFGTGFSNLSYLKQLPIDTIKIDRSFVRNITTDAGDAAIVKSIVALARNLNLDTVGEGVETVEQLDALREYGCQKVQGYYFSKPIPVEQCRALLEHLGTARKLTDTVKARAFKVG